MTSSNAPQRTSNDVLISLKIAELKNELKRREVSFAPSLWKAGLQQLLQQSLHLPINNTSTDNINHATNHSNDDDTTQPEIPIPEFTEPEIPWVDSDAWKLLVQDVIDGVVPQEPDHLMPLSTIFTSRPEYAPYGYKNFLQRLSTIWAQVKHDLSRKDEDLAAFEVFRQLNIAHTHSPHGYLEWEGSKAQEQLQRDIDDGLHNNLQPKELWLLQEVYDDFPLKVFRDHIAQEIKTWKLEVLPHIKGHG
jgi:hypothetical protein